MPASLMRVDHVGGILDLELSSLRADLGGVVIEDHGDLETAVRKSMVACEGMTDVAGADQCHVPDAVHLQDGAQFIEQEGDVVAGALLAELAELGDILADLGGGDAHLFAQVLGGGGLHAEVRHALQGS